jgi:hypothetical protein
MDGPLPGGPRILRLLANGGMTTGTIGPTVLEIKKKKSVHVLSGSRIMPAISLAGTRVMNRMSVEGTVPGRFANGMRAG